LNERSEYQNTGNNELIEDIIKGASGQVYNNSELDRLISDNDCCKNRYGPQSRLSGTGISSRSIVAVQHGGYFQENYGITAVIRANIVSQLICSCL